MNSSELQALAIAHSHRKKMNAHMHIGRHVTDPEWLEVVEARKQAKAEQDRRKAIQYERLLRRPKRWRNTRERLEAKRRRESPGSPQYELRQIEERMKREQVIRRTLFRVARIARNMGFSVRSSKCKKGKVSSYYATRNNQRPIRISDHELPLTIERESNLYFYGRCPFASELLIDSELSITRIRRLLLLAEAERI